MYYEYGYGSTGRGSGRVIRQQDASGVQHFSYGAMGEIIQNIHTFVLPQNNTYTLQMNFEYDSWNRIKSIAYPDGEVVTYGYDAAGQLFSMQGMKGQDPYGYIDTVLYDRYGSRKTIQYSNGTLANYTYDPTTLRLSGLRSYDSYNNQMQNLSYQYDDASNITAISNSAAALPNGLGGTYTYGYQYDSLYRLTAGGGSFIDANNDTCSNLTIMGYSASGNITNKQVIADILIDGSVQSVNYQNAYTYNTNQQPHTLESAGSSSFGWDANGNMLSQNNRHLCWDEENRLGSVRDPEHLSVYLYNAGGERAWKFTGEVAQMTLSGKIQIDMAYLTNKTLYASSFFVANDLGYTKHYFAGSERVCSKLGGGMAPAPVSVTDTVVEPLAQEYDEYGNDLQEYLNRLANCAPNELTVYLDFDPELQCFAPDNLEANEPETEQYFYHPDHLGSSSFISDAAGQGYQHLQYMPFGETFVSQKINTWSTPYQFSAKEKDDETGFSYFGARYYNSDVSVWLSVDPMADKYPSMSPFMYCAGTPVMLVDPDGRSSIKPDSERKRNRKIAKFERKEARMEYKTGMTGDALRENMYEKYAKRKFIYVTISTNSAGGGNNNSQNSFYPTGDLLDLKNGVTTTQTTSNAQTSYYESNQAGTFNPISININPADNSTSIQVANVLGLTAPANVSIQGNDGSVITTGSIQDPGDALTANINTNSFSQLNINIQLHPNSLRTNANPTGIPGRGCWEFIGIGLTVTRTRTTTIRKLPRIISFNGSFFDLINAGKFTF